MSAFKKPIHIAGDSKLEVETKRFNTRALIGSIVIHLFFFLLKLPHLVLEHKMHDEPKLEPIKMEFITTAARSALIRNKVIATESEKIPEPVPPPVVTKKIKNGTEKVVKNSKAVGNPIDNKVQAVQKGDPRSQKKTVTGPAELFLSAIERFSISATRLGNPVRES